MLNQKMTIGNLTVCTENTGVLLNVTIANGCDVVMCELYNPNVDEQKAIDATLGKLDIYPQSLVYSVFLERHSENTYEIPHYTEPSDWFCRIDDTKYFKHFYKRAEDFIKNKGGKRIIDL